MIGHAFDSVQWGGARKASAAANKRDAELKERGYTTFRSVKSFGLNENPAYYVLAFSDQEDFDNVKPALPEHTTHDRRLNARTIHVGMDVMVEHVQGERIDHRHGWRGNVVGVTLQRDGLAMATVQFAGPDSKRVKIEVFRLRQVAR